MSKARSDSAAPKRTLEELDNLIEKYHLLKHPFYRAWTEGTLSKESLQLYAAQYYQHVRAFPENLKQLASRAKRPAWSNSSRKILRKNSTLRHRTLFSGAILPNRLDVNGTTLDEARPLPGITALSGCIR